MKNLHLNGSVTLVLFITHPLLKYAKYVKPKKNIKINFITI